MLGFGALGEFALGQGPVSSAFVSAWFAPFGEPRRRNFTQPQLLISPLPDTVIESRWHQPWSEPAVKAKAGPAASRQQFFAFQPTPIINVGWFANLSEPVRIKPGAKAYHQQFSIFNPFPITSITWFEWLAEPVRKKPGLVAPIQPFFQFSPRPFVSFGWFENLSEPVRKKPRLLEGDQKELGRAEFVPTNYSASMYAVENLDFFQAVLSQFNIPISALVDIIAKDPKHLGNMGIIENVAEPSIVASIATPSAAGTSGAPVSNVAGARVAIILR